MSSVNKDIDLRAPKNRRDAIPLPVTCPQIFYAYGASYPDGICHNKHIDDADSDHCSEEYKPCPVCESERYQIWLMDDQQIISPYGFGDIVPGDYFAPADFIAYAAQRQKQ